MLNEVTVATEIYKFSVNYSIELKYEIDETGKKKCDYIKFLFEDLKDDGFSDDEFIYAIKQIKRTTTTTYNKMPSLAMFLEIKTKQDIENSYNPILEMRRRREENELEIINR